MIDLDSKADHQLGGGKPLASFRQKNRIQGIIDGSNRSPNLGSRKRDKIVPL